MRTTELGSGWRRAEAASRLQRFGRNELTENVKPKWKIFVEQFTGPMPCMIWMAAGVELIIRDWPNFWILMVLQSVNGLLGFHESTKAGDAVAALKVRARVARCPEASEGEAAPVRPAGRWMYRTLRVGCDTCGWWDNETGGRNRALSGVWRATDVQASLRPEAMVKRDATWRKINASELVPGDLVVLGAGAAVPADCRVCPNAKPIEIDQAALTGAWGSSLTLNNTPLASMEPMSGVPLHTHTTCVWVTEFLTK